MSNIWYPGTPLPPAPVGGSVPVVVPNMATLRTVPGSLFPAVYMEGYYTPGDGGSGWYNYNAGSIPAGCVFQGTITGNVLNVTQINAGSLSVGQVLNGRGITAIAPGTAISSLGTGTGGIGTYNLYGSSQAVGSALMIADDGGTVVVANDAINSWSKNSAEPLSYKNFGAYADNTTDDTVYMQAAHTTKKVINVGYYFYKFNTLNINAGGIIGPGSDYARINSFDVNNGGNTITVNASNLEPGIAAPIFQGFTFTGQGATKSNGSGIFISAPTSENQGGKISRVTLYNHPTALSFQAASGWTVSEYSIINYSRAGISINNTNNADSGDNKIVNGFIGSSIGVTPVGVSWQDGGGLIFTGNKVNGGAFGMLFQLAAGASTSIIQISTNSIENQTTQAIAFSRPTGTSSLSNIIITDNEIAINPTGITFDASGAWGDITIANNTIQLAPGTGTCIALQSGNNFNIGGNTLTGNGGTPSGIVVAAACSNGKIGSNTYGTLSTYINNLSVTTTIAWDIQIATVGPTTGNVAYGTLFASSIATTFGKPFKQIAAVTSNVPTGSGGTVGSNVINQTVNGCTIQVVTATNNVVNQVQYTALGIL